MIKIIGTTHLTPAKEIEDIISSEKPEVIGIELCELREKVMLNQIQVDTKNKDESLLGRITSKIKQKAEQEGLDYGSDMKTALNYSINHNLPHVLVDMPIVKIQELFGKIPKEEQEGFTKALMEFEKTKELKQTSDNLNEEAVIQEMKQKYPIAFEFLINMRNIFITNQILKATIKYPEKKILIFLGKAHVDSVNMMLGGLSEVRNI